jgi:hypothetical protein
MVDSNSLREVGFWGNLRSSRGTKVKENKELYAGESS